jgi:hypothetical protein
MPMGISKAAGAQTFVNNRIACQAANNVWFADPNDVTGQGVGTCVPANAAASPNFNANMLFANWTTGGGSTSTSGPAGAQPIPNAATAPLPVTNALHPSVINGPVPDITAAWPPTISQAPLADCPNQFDVWVDEHRTTAVIALLAVFALFGGLK